ncbi:MAG: VWA domain-containing protein [Vicinamibacteria bacterium]
MRAATAALLLLAGTARAQAPAPPVFEAKVDSVYVDAFVVKDGAPVRGLAAENFELRDEGAVRPAELVRVESVPLVALLAFDVSGSVTGEKLRELQAASALFLSQLDEADQAGLLTFSDDVAWRVPPTTDKQQVARGIAALQPRGGTALFDALFAAVTVPTAPARPLVVLFSDGQDSASWLDARRVERALARSNALVHIVGLVPSPKAPHVRVLRDLAQATGGRFWAADSPERLRPAFAGIAEAMRRRYLLRFEPAAGGKPGWHRLELRLKNAGGDVQARPGYWAR